MASVVVMVMVPVVMAVVTAMVVVMVTVVVVLSVGWCNSADGGCCCDKGENGFLHSVANCSLGTSMLHDQQCPGVL
jgi:hypothetical protein